MLALGAAFITDKSEDYTQLHELVIFINEIHADIKKSIAKLVKQALHKLLQKATVIVTASSIATKSEFTFSRHTYCLLLDELHRFNDVDAIEIFSLYWNVSIRFMIGDSNQLPHMTFGPDELNPFQKQAQLPAFNRF